MQLPVSSDAPLIVEGVSKSFRGNPAVQDVSFTVAPGDFVAVLGASGAGKSTLLRLVNRLIEADQGSIRLGNFDLQRATGRTLRTWRSRCAMIFQHFHLTDRLDVVTNVLIGTLSAMHPLRSLVGAFSRAERLRAAEALERVGMLPFALQRAGELSGGQKQRVAIARAMMQRPFVLLADEPISALDPASSRTVLDLMRELCQEQGVRLLVNLHDVQAARDYASRIVGMRAGRMVYNGAAGAFTADAEHALFGTAHGPGTPPQAAPVRAAAAAAIPSAHNPATDAA